MSEFHRLRAYLQSKATFTEDELAFMETLYEPRALRAGEFLQRAGDVGTRGAFVATGVSASTSSMARAKSTSFDAASLRRQVESIPAAAAAFRSGLQRAGAAKEQQIVNALSMSAEDRYEEFLKKYPSIAQRVPQFMLASYLGVSPETLSRIRKNRSRK